MMSLGEPIECQAVISQKRTRMLWRPRSSVGTWMFDATVADHNGVAGCDAATDREAASRHLQEVVDRPALQGEIMRTFDSRRSTAERLVDTYGTRAVPIIAEHMEDAIKAGREHDMLYWDQVRRIVEMANGSENGSK